MRIFYVTEFSPFEPRFGAQQRTLHMLRALERCGEVSIALLHRAERSAVGAGRDPRILVEAGYRLAPLGVRKFGADATLTRALDARVDLSSFDLVCARCLDPITKLALPSTARVLVDLDDLGYTYPSAGSLPARIAGRAKTWLRAWLEQRAMRRYGRFFFLSARDRARFPDLAGNVLPNIPVLPRTAPDVEASGTTLMFVGALWYGPNQQGVAWFLEHCWPAIRAQSPAARLRIVGDLPDDLRPLWSALEGVEVSGFVPDLDAAYAAATLAVVPVFAGGGTNIKVLEALAHARACVTTPFALRGFAPQLKAGVDLDVAGDAESMVASCVALLRDGAARRRLATAGRASVLRHYSFDAFSAVVAAEVAACMAD